MELYRLADKILMFEGMKAAERLGFLDPDFLARATASDRKRFTKKKVTASTYRIK